MIVDGLARVEGALTVGLEKIETSLSTKADRKDVEDLRKEHSDRLERLEMARRVMWKRVGGIVTVIAAVAVAAAAVAQAVG